MFHRNSWVALTCGNGGICFLHLFSSVAIVVFGLLYRSVLSFSVFSIFLERLLQICFVSDKCIM